MGAWLYLFREWTLDRVGLFTHGFCNVYGEFIISRASVLLCEHFLVLEMRERPLQRSFLFDSARSPRSITSWGIIIVLLFSLELLNSVGSKSHVNCSSVGLDSQRAFIGFPPKTLRPVVSLVYKSFHKWNSPLRVWALCKVLRSVLDLPKPKGSFPAHEWALNPQPLGPGDKYPLLAQTFTSLLFHFPLCFWHLQICFSYLWALTVHLK